MNDGPGKVLLATDGSPDAILASRRASGPLEPGEEYRAQAWASRALGRPRGRTTAGEERART
jgi:hypothetical protein